MGKTFRDVHVCHTNDFDPKSNDKIKGWVEYNGGLFSRGLTAEVTHLIVSPKAWNQKVPIVKAAMKLQEVKIVKLDWLEDSPLSPSKKPLKTLPYEYYPRATKLTRKPTSMTATTHRTRPRKKNKSREIARTGLRFDRECQTLVDDMAKNGYIPFNANNVTHIVYLLRNDISKERIEQLRLKLFQSDTEPPQYACYALYSSPFGHADHGTVAPKGSSYQFAIESFRKYFRKKTGEDFEDQKGASFDDSSVLTMLTDGSDDKYYIHVERESEEAIEATEAKDDSSFTSCLSRTVRAAETSKENATQESC